MAVGTTDRESREDRADRAAPGSGMAETWGDRASRVAREALRPHAPAVDAENRFPAEAVEGLRRAELLAFAIPAELRASESSSEAAPCPEAGDFREMVRVAAALGAECLSTGFLWAQHTQHVAALVRHGGPACRPVLEEIARRGLLVGSVTTEYGKGGDLLTAQAPLEEAEDGRLRVRRRTPIVGYGAEAGLYLVTMRAGEDRPQADVRLMLVRPEDPGRVEVTGDWRAMGMRGTRSVPMEFDVLVERDRVVGDSFRALALETLVPAGHLGWSAIWHGAARGALERFTGGLRRLRGPARAKLKSDHFLARLARLRTRVDLVQALLERVAGRLDALRAEGADTAGYEDIALNIELNNLKIAASEESLAVVDGLIELAGVSAGYLQGQELGLERIFRDLRSGPLMFHNDRLLGANARLMMVEASPMSGVWRR